MLLGMFIRWNWQINDYVYNLRKVLLQFILYLLHTVMPKPLIDAEELYYFAGVNLYPQ